MRTATARASTAPSTTLVFDGRSLPAAIGRGELLERYVRPARALVTRERADLGAKNIVLLGAGPDGVLPLMFFQGLPNGSIDPTVEVCGNSAACAVAVARHLWNAVGDGPLRVRMGTETLTLEEIER
jgi:hypothetical protein